MTAPARCRKCGHERRPPAATADDLRKALGRARDHLRNDGIARAYGYLDGVVDRVAREMGGLCRYCA